MGKYYNKTGIEKKSWLAAAARVAVSGVKGLSLGKIAPAAASMAAWSAPELAMSGLYKTFHGVQGGKLFERVKPRFRTQKFPVDTFASERGMINRANAGIS